MKRLIPLVILVLFSTAGCEALHFRGTSPNVRSFSEDPNLNQYYIGVDLEFVVVDPPTDPARHASLSEPQAPQDTEDLPRELPEPRNLPF